MDFSNKVILIVGGSSGIGEGCVRNFAKCNATVIFCSNDKIRGELIEKELMKFRVKFLFCDVTNEGDIISIVDYVKLNYGEVLDCLINVVGTHPEDRMIDDFSASDFDLIFSINVRSHFLSSKYCLPAIRKCKGSIINIASMVGSIGQRCAVTYAATKGAVLAMTKSLALDEGVHGVRVNSVSPGIIDTPLLTKVTELNVATLGDTSFENEINRMKMLTPLGNIGTVDDVAHVCMFLASDWARHITGSDIPVSGGAEVGYGVKFVKK